MLELSARTRLFCHTASMFLLISQTKNVALRHVPSKAETAAGVSREIVVNQENNLLYNSERKENVVDISLQQ